MKSRQEIKALAKESFRDQYGTGVLIVLLLILFGFAFGIVYSIPIVIGMVGGIAAADDPLWVMRLLVPAGAMGMLTSLLSLVFYAVVYVLGVNVCGAYTKVYLKERTSAGEPFSQLSVNFWRKLGGYLWMWLFISLWSLLFIIPGIVKAYSYRMAPYILARHPDVRATEALRLSKEMTRGNKGKLFVMDLSFIGWGLLSAIPFAGSVLGVVWVLPYYSTTSAGFFVEIRDKALEDGIIVHAELGMAMPEAEQSEFQANVPPPPPM